MADFRRLNLRTLLATASLLALAACSGGSGGFDVDMRNLSGGLDTTDATRLATERRPAPDENGIISYPNFQVVVAQRGDTIRSMAGRLGLGAKELADYNGIAPDVPLRAGEVIALPRKVDTSGEDGNVDITSLASGALDRVDGGNPPEQVETTTLDPPAAGPAPESSSGPEPIRHKVERGETAYSIARRYKVSVRSLAEWNGLGSDMNVREGAYLLIPVASDDQPAPPPPETAETTSAPGEGTLTPEPPSASKPLPEENEVASVAPPPSPSLSEERSEENAARLLLPVSGSIIRPYDKGKNDGIDIASSAGTPVKVADDGVIAAITRDTEEVPILVVRHANNLLTVYANIQNIPVSKGDRVTRGQTIAEVRDTSPAFLHFEVREGFESVDPVPYVN
ncbi:peptidoglycan DD-metalloendopeptidase family protein [Psychromarinibacter sp. C21-152]|uniref:Peptidoglycan DD-metalloendopeptidase family protein n=1 Tax=Psychromarinibacter sediminicola TaxID=3033385 RepID=A0AAE3T799_9RHOB|nr:peptidoglycan DD-metalloendopeptidase family protein [Psychromarinibacter sediminicola]MDF0600097.1 peptidoglycan DD-metalloendopeptidase family protein [Psychromarinibacter sediminicola]